MWGNWGEYMLDPKWRAWGMEGLGIGEVSIAVDLFATPWTAAAPLFITKEMNSFGYDWGRLCATQGESLLWANPPFRMLIRVAEKTDREPCWVALCTPEWENEE